jgi:hypothetical protein
MFRVGQTTRSRNEIRLQEDERIVGVKSFAHPSGYLDEVKFKIARE